MNESQFCCASFTISSQKTRLNIAFIRNDVPWLEVLQFKSETSGIVSAAAGQAFSLGSLPRIAGFIISRWKLEQDGVKIVVELIHSLNN